MGKVWDGMLKCIKAEFSKKRTSEQGQTRCSAAAEVSSLCLLINLCITMFFTPVLSWPLFLLQKERKTSLFLFAIVCPQSIMCRNYIVPRATHLCTVWQSALDDNAVLSTPCCIKTYKSCQSRTFDSVWQMVSTFCWLCRSTHCYCAVLQGTCTPSWWLCCWWHETLWGFVSNDILTAPGCQFSVQDLTEWWLI